MNENWKSVQTGQAGSDYQITTGNGKVLALVPFQKDRATASDAKLMALSSVMYGFLWDVYRYCSDTQMVDEARKIIIEADIDGD